MEKWKKKKEEEEEEKRASDDGRSGDQQRGIAERFQRPGCEMNVGEITPSSPRGGAGTQHVLVCVCSVCLCAPAPIKIR